MTVFIQADLLNTDTVLQLEKERKCNIFNSISFLYAIQYLLNFKMNSYYIIFKQDEIEIKKYLKSLKFTCSLQAFLLGSVFKSNHIYSHQK